METRDFLEVDVSNRISTSGDTLSIRLHNGSCLRIENYYGRSRIKFKLRRQVVYYKDFYGSVSRRADSNRFREVISFDKSVDLAPEGVDLYARRAPSDIE